MAFVDQAWIGMSSTWLTPMRQTLDDMRLAKTAQRAAHFRGTSGIRASYARGR